MISRRNFFSICIMMFTIFILFQFTVVGRDFTNNYDKNEHLTETGLTRTDAWSEQLAGDTAQTVIYIGSENDAAFRIVRQWCGYTKRRFAQYDSLDSYVRSGSDTPVLLCLNGDIVATSAQVETLQSMVQAGQNVVFCDLPEIALLGQFSELQTMLGIKRIVQEQVELTGIKLFSGFLLGGDVIYTVEEEQEKLNEEIELFAPWFQRMSGTKSYMVGTLEEEDVGNEDLPSLIWRNSYGNGRVFVVNGPYFQDETGLGILSAVIYELQDYDLYPVVNAQNLSVVNYPILASENTEELMEIYARNLPQLQKNLMWSGMISSANKGNYKMTNFLTPRLDYSAQDDLQADDLSFYLTQFWEQDAETGLSLDHLPGASLGDKLAADQSFFASSGATYSYSAAFVDDEEREAFLATDLRGVLENIYTITGLWSDTDLLSYCSDTIVAQGVTADGFTHSYLQDLRVRAIETALAYNNILLNMKRIVWPAKDDYHWEVLHERYSSNINTHWNKFAAFDKTTLSESDARIRTFFALDYHDERQENTVKIEITKGGNDHWFILRTHDETIRDIVGGDYVELEEDVYFIHAKESNLLIELEERQNKQYYLP